MNVVFRLGVVLALSGCAVPPAARSAVEPAPALDTAVARFEAADYAGAARIAEAVLESEPDRRDGDRVFLRWSNRLPGTAPDGG